MQTCQWIQNTLFGCCHTGRAQPREAQAEREVTTPLIRPVRVLAPDARQRSASIPVPAPALRTRMSERHIRRFSFERLAPIRVPACQGDRKHLGQPSPLTTREAPPPALADGYGAQALRWEEDGDALVQGWSGQAEGRVPALTHLLAWAVTAHESDQPAAARCILRWLPQLLAPVMRHDFSRVGGPELTFQERAAARDVLRGFLRGLRMQGHGEQGIHHALVTAMACDARRLAPVVKAAQYFLSEPSLPGDRHREALTSLQGLLYRHLLHALATGGWRHEEYRMARLLRDWSREGGARHFLMSAIPVGVLNGSLAAHDLRGRSDEIVSVLGGAGVCAPVARLAASYLEAQDVPQRFDWRKPLPVGDQEQEAAEGEARW